MNEDEFNRFTQWKELLHDDWNNKYGNPRYIIARMMFADHDTAFASISIERKK